MHHLVKTCAYTAEQQNDREPLSSPLPPWFKSSKLSACVQVTAQLTGWRTSSGLLLREPATASVDYTPALAKYGLLTSPSLSSTTPVVLPLPFPAFHHGQVARDRFS